MAFATRVALPLSATRVATNRPNRMGVFLETPSLYWMAVGSLKELIRPLAGIVFSPAGCHNHSPHEQASEGNQFSRRLPHHATGSTELHVTSGSQET